MVVRHLVGSSGETVSTLTVGSLEGDQGGDPDSITYYQLSLEIT